MSHTIKVSISRQHSYPIYVGQNLWNKFHSFCEVHYSSKKLFVIVDEKVWGLHSKNIQAGCNSFFDTLSVFQVPEGEQSKSVEKWNKMMDYALDKGIERSTPILAIGGGVTGDLGGFAAASILRGVPLLHMPTSLLAMVDSSIGGKTGINHSTGKNLIGAFYQPDAVFADINFLATLEENEWVNGLAEMLKYAAIKDQQLFKQLNLEIGRGFIPSSKWASLIKTCAKIKTEIVEQDTLEAGVRAYLNFGHTFAHALEKDAGFGVIAHGEAVIVGMLAAIYASNKVGAELDSTRFDPFLPLYEISLDFEAIKTSRLIELMHRDKKVKDGVIRLVLLKDWEKPFLYDCADEELLAKAWQFAFNKLKNN